MNATHASSSTKPGAAPSVLILRPEPGASASVQAGRALGLPMAAFPLFEVHARPWVPPLRDGVDALLLGSANALRHAGPALERYRGLPAYAVGETTASAARAAGLDVLATGRGGLQAVLGELAPDHRRLLRLTGRERVALELPPGVTITTCEVYASEAAPFPAGMEAALNAPCIVLLHSGEAAARFESFCKERKIARERVHLAAIGARVTQRLEAGWARLEVSPEPSDAALLALAARMCQDMPSGSVQADNQT